MYEVQMGLVTVYGADWSWARDAEYKVARAALKHCTIETEIKMDPAKRNSNKSEFMSEEQVKTMLDHVWDQAVNAENFCSKLSHLTRYFIISLLIFSCLRGREEIALCTVDEISIIDDESLLFQMKRDYKSHKLDAQMNVIHKPSRILLGKRLHEIFLLLKDKRKPTKNSNRLFLKPLPSASSKSDFYWSDAPIGKTVVGQTVQYYVKQLAEYHPLFQDCSHFTNTSLRKYHCDRLSDAGAPLIVQQASLAQNTRAYARGADDLETKRKVANIVQGNSRSWHEPMHHNKENILPPAKKIQISSESLDTWVEASHDAGLIKISINKGGSNFNFEYKL
jgi:hypothetical protein